MNLKDKYNKYPFLYILPASLVFALLLNAWLFYHENYPVTGVMIASQVIVYALLIITFRKKIFLPHQPADNSTSVQTKPLNSIQAFLGLIGVLLLISSGIIHPSWRGFDLYWILLSVGSILVFGPRIGRTSTLFKKVVFAFFVIYPLANLGIEIKNLLSSPADIELLMGNCGEAVKIYTRDIEAKNHNMANLYNNMSWLYLTCPETNFRDAKKALEYSQKAATFDGYSKEMADTAACAYAANGLFDKAVKIASDFKLYRRQKIFEDKELCN